MLLLRLSAWTRSVIGIPFHHGILWQTNIFFQKKSMAKFTMLFNSAYKTDFYLLFLIISTGFFLIALASGIISPINSETTAAAITANGDQTG